MIIDLSRINARLTAAIALGLLLLGLCMCAAKAQEAEHPAFGTRQVIQLTVTADVADIPKLEARAVEILRRWDPLLSLAGARDKVRVDGKTDVARCLEYITIYQLQQVSQAHMTGIRQEVQHPQPAAP